MSPPPYGHPKIPTTTIKFDDRIVPIETYFFNRLLLFDLRGA
jgi:hypothetical protein